MLQNIGSHEEPRVESQDIRSWSEEKLILLCREHGLPDFRGRQIFAGVHRHGARSWEEIPSLSADARGKLAGILMFEPARLMREWHSRDGTVKYLFGLADGESVETVLVPDFAASRRTLCVSTQVGCPVGCAFCATGQEGFRRNLAAGEIVGQVLEVVRAGKECEARDGFKISNVVFMGMGEPFLNMAMFLDAVNLLHAEGGLNIGMRRMTVSTCGVVPGILELAEKNDQMGLAVSLHSGFDEVRDRLVPMNRKYPLAVLMEACRVYGAKTRRRITFEMVLSEETCTEEEAYALIRLLRGLIAHVNLIPVNPAGDCGLRRPGRERVARFKGILERACVPVSVREEKGVDIEAACGQLRRASAG